MAPIAEGLSLEVVIPIRDMQDHVADCLRPLLEQRRPHDVITVVDDGSTDATATRAAALGAHVIRFAESRGPYASRHSAAVRSRADGLVFIDGRSRALPGLLDSHRRQLTAAGVAMSCTQVDVIAGPTFAGRIAAQQGIFSLDKYIGVPGRLDYFPTCNLGVRREAYLAVGGLRHMRSGGDADLCWRIERAGLGRLSFEPKTFMQWVPRDSVRDLARQWYRYGESAATLALMYPRSEGNGTPPGAPRVPLRRKLARLGRHAADNFPAAVVVVGLELVMRRGAARTRRHPPAISSFKLLGQVTDAGTTPTP